MGNYGSYRPKSSCFPQFIVEITHDKRGVMQGFTTNSDISNTKAKPECF